MANKPLSREVMQQAMDAVAEFGSYEAAARELKIPATTLKSRHYRAKGEGVKPTVRAKLETENDLLVSQVKTLETEIRALQREKLTAEVIKRHIIGIRDAKPKIPAWVQKAPRKASHSPGVPTLFASDWHWAEKVDPDQIGGVNEFNLELAHARARGMIENAIELLRDHLAYPDYPGIVFALGGDMLSGDIHEELSATNEIEVMPALVDLHGVLIWCIEQLLAQFGKVFVPCATGNHGRNTKKIRMKGRNHTSFDWLLYHFLEKHFEDNPNVTFLIPDGSDAFYRIYGHRYLLTHGDQFRGGDGMIGALGPIIRGDHKKRSRNAQVDQEYDTMILGHWHQLIQLKRVIVNGSLKGYDEYAYANNFGFEEPAQAMWITHPVHGITFSMPIYCDRRPKKKAEDAWVSLPG